jgi:hypothetical protein
MRRKTILRVWSIEHCVVFWGLHSDISSQQ